MIHESMTLLEPEEKAVITALFFRNPENLSERKVAKKMGIPQRTFNDRKNATFEKMKKYCKSAAQNGYMFSKYIVEGYDTDQPLCAVYPGMVRYQ